LPRKPSCLCMSTSFLLLSSFSPPTTIPSPRGPSSAASPPSVSHASRKRRFSPLSHFPAQPSPYGP
jgi:hypothetical protein